MTTARTSVDLAGRRVAILCGHFVPELGYQEVDLAASFARLQAQTRVITTTEGSPNARRIGIDSYPAGSSRGDGYDITRLSPRLTIGPNIVGCDVRPAISSFDPDYVVLVGPGKMFGLEAFASVSAPFRRIVIFQDNSDDGRSRARGTVRGLVKAAGHTILKRPAYRRVVRAADRIVLNVPETRGIVESWLGAAERRLLSATAVELRLGFDPQKFYFDREERDRWRRERSVAPEEILLTTCTRATPGKGLETLIDSVSRLWGGGLAIRYVLAGLLEDEYARTLRARVAAQPNPEAFIVLPLLRQDEMRKVFAGCDLGFWPRAAITIQQAMGTGLPVVLRKRPNVSHVLSPGRNGWYVEPHQTLEEIVEVGAGSLGELSVDERLQRRQATAAFNHAILSYDRIALEMVAGL